MPKDLFSGHAKDYAAFRPTYPEPLYQHIFSHCQGFDLAWDCATGNGQVAVRLARQFREIYATDISQAQIDYAPKIPNIRYALSQAEKTHFDPGFFDLVTVGQAFHWFDHDSFFHEAKRVLKPEGVLAVWGYGLLHLEHELLDKVLKQFYYEVTGPYWEPERQLIDAEYATIDFPFRKAWPAKFPLELTFTIDRLIHYVNTWSAVKKYERIHHRNPVEGLRVELLKILKDEGVTFNGSHRLFLKIGTL